MSWTLRELKILGPEDIIYIILLILCFKVLCTLKNDVFVINTLFVYICTHTCYLKKIWEINERDKLSLTHAAQGTVLAGCSSVFGAWQSCWFFFITLKGDSHFHIWFLLRILQIMWPYPLIWLAGTLHLFYELAHMMCQLKKKLVNLNFFLSRANRWIKYCVLLHVKYSCWLRFNLGRHSDCWYWLVNTISLLQFILKNCTFYDAARVNNT